MLFRSHMHPLAGKAPVDETYTDAGDMGHDQAAFQKWFYGPMQVEMSKLVEAMRSKEWRDTKLVAMNA